jgi:ATP-dependent helicase/DNAse subunit B
MPKDKYSAIWISHTSINDFLQCPRSYFLKNLYKDKTTGNKMQITSPSLALGSAVHEVIESLSTIPTQTRFDKSLVLQFDDVWQKYSGKKGGFLDIDEEHKYKERGKAMLRKVMDNPGPLASLSVKIKEEVPYYWLSEDENIILCGKVDWLEYFPDTDSVHIIDFKTSKKEEDANSLQLPIYHLLVRNCQKRSVAKASYWYLEFSDKPVEKELPDVSIAHDKVLEVGRKIKLARKLEKLDCLNGDEGCVFCRPFEAILRGEGEFVGVNNRRDIYLLPRQTVTEEAEESFIL